MLRAGRILQCRPQACARLIISDEKSSATTSACPRAAAASATMPGPVATSSTRRPPSRDSSGVRSTIETAIGEVRVTLALSSSAFVAMPVTLAKLSEYAAAPACHILCSSAVNASVAAPRAKRRAKLDGMGRDTERSISAPRIAHPRSCTGV